MENFPLTLTLVHQWTEGWDNSQQVVFVPASAGTNGTLLREHTAVVDCTVSPLNRFTVEEEIKFGGGRTSAKGETVMVFSKKELWAECPEGHVPAVGNWAGDVFEVEQFVSPI